MSYIDNTNKNNIHWVSIQSLDYIQSASTIYLKDHSDYQVSQHYVSLLRPEDKKSQTSEAKDFIVPTIVLHYETNTTTTSKDIQQIWSSKHGLEAAFSYAWANHAGIVISPDDILIAIQGMLGKYINKNAEELRSLFVNHQGKKVLKVDLQDPDNWRLFKSLTIDKISQETKDKLDIKQVLAPEFSSSTLFDQSMKCLAVMDLMQNYFEYHFRCMCGITRVGFLGSLDDWKLLKETIIGLKILEIKDNSQDKYFPKERPFIMWIQDLLDIINQFINTYQGIIDVVWWNSIVTKTRVSGSGGSDYHQGWLNVFLTQHPLDQKLDVYDIPSFRFNVPVKVDYYGNEFNVNILGGFTGFAFNTQEKYYQPIRSEAIIKLFDQEEEEEEEKQDIEFEKIKKRMKEISSSYGSKNWSDCLKDIEWKNLYEEQDKILEQKRLLTKKKFQVQPIYYQIISLLTSKEKLNMSITCAKQLQDYLVDVVKENILTKDELEKIWNDFKQSIMTK